MDHIGTREAGLREVDVFRATEVWAPEEGILTTQLCEEPEDSFLSQRECVEDVQWTDTVGREGSLEEASLVEEGDRPDTGPRVGFDHLHAVASEGEEKTMYLIKDTTEEYTTEWRK